MAIISVNKAGVNKLLLLRYSIFILSRRREIFVQKRFDLAARRGFLNGGAEVGGGHFFEHMTAVSVKCAARLLLSISAGVSFAVRRYSVCVSAAVFGEAVAFGAGVLPHAPRLMSTISISDMHSTFFGFIVCAPFKTGTY